MKHLKIIWILETFIRIGTQQIVWPVNDIEFVLKKLWPVLTFLNLLYASRFPQKLQYQLYSLYCTLNIAGNVIF
jgi:hypothetical protein